MFDILKWFLVTAALFGLSESLALFDKLQKCQITDNVCQQKWLADLIDIVADSGIPELNIPRADPYIAKNIDISLFGLLQLTLTDGKISGVKPCVSKNLKFDLENQQIAFDLECKLLEVEGHYKLKTLPGFKAILSDIDIHADGNAKLDLEDLHLSLVWPFEVKKLEDGELHFLLKSEESTYTYDLKGKLVFHGDNMFVGSVDISSVVNDVVNENWKFISKAVGKSILDEVFEIFYIYSDKLLRGVTAKEIFGQELAALPQN